MKSGIAVALLLCPLFLFAQQSDVATQISGTPQTTEFLPFADHLTVAFIHENAAEIMVFREDFSLIMERAVYDLGLSQGAAYLGMSEEQNTWHLYFLNRGSLVGIQIPRAGDPSVVRLEGYGNASFSGSFTFNGTMHLLRMSAWDNELRLVKFRDGQRVFSETFPITTPEFVARANGDFHRMEDNSSDISDSYYPAKWYRFGDRLVFTLDSEGSTELVEIDLLTSVVNETRFDWDESGAAAGGNSLCLGTYLLHSSLYADSLRLSLVETASRQTMMVGSVSARHGLMLQTFLPGWYTNREGLYLPDEQGRQLVTDDATGWLEALNRQENLGISVSPTERGFQVQAGGLSASEEFGASGMVIDEHFRKILMRFELMIPGAVEELEAPLVFSSLRSSARVNRTSWSQAPVYFSLDRDGVFRIWR